MSATKDIDLRIRAADGFGMDLGCATIEYDPTTESHTSCIINVDRPRGLKWTNRTIDCLADSDGLVYDDKPLAAMVSLIAQQWLESKEGQDWTQGLALTRGERREMALELAYDCEWEMAQWTARARATS
jgi:hypothetical protein